MRKLWLSGRELDALVEQHRELDERLRELGRHAYLTPAEQTEVRTIKKLKLVAKDRIRDLQVDLTAK